MFQKSPYFHPATLVALIAFLIPFGELPKFLGAEFSLIKIGTLVLAGWGVIHCLMTRGRMSRTSYDVPIAGLCVALLITLPRTDYPEELTIVTITIFGYLVFNLVTQNIVTNLAQIRRVLNCYLFSSFLVSLLAILQSVTGKTWVDVSGRDELYLTGKSLVVLGTSSNPNSFATYFILAIPFGLSFLITRKAVFPRLLWGMLITLYTVVTVMTLSRGAMLGIFIACGVIAVIAKNLRMLTISKTALVGALFLSPVLYFLAENPQYGPAAHILRNTEYTIVDKFEAVDVRRHLYRANLLMFFDSPLFGVGYGMSRHYISSYGSPYAGITPHNVLLAIASELGIFALFAYCFILYIGGRVGLKSIHLVRTRQECGVVLALFGGYLGQLIFGLTHSNYVSIAHWLPLSLLPLTYKILLKLRRAELSRPSLVHTIDDHCSSLT